MKAHWLANLEKGASAIHDASSRKRGNIPSAHEVETYCDNLAEFAPKLTVSFRLADFSTTI